MGDKAMYDFHSHCFCSDSIYLTLFHPAHLDPNTLALRARPLLTPNFHYFLFYEHKEDEFRVLKSMPLSPLIRGDKYVRTLSRTTGIDREGNPISETWNLTLLYVYTKREVLPQGEKDLTELLARATADGVELFIFVDEEEVFSLPKEGGFTS